MAIHLLTKPYIFHSNILLRFAYDFIQSVCHSSRHNKACYLSLGRGEAGLGFACREFFADLPGCCSDRGACIFGNSEEKFSYNFHCTYGIDGNVPIVLPTISPSSKMFFHSCKSWSFKKPQQLPFFHSSHSHAEDIEFLLAPLQGHIFLTSRTSFLYVCLCLSFLS